MGRTVIFLITAQLFSFSAALANPPLPPGKPAGIKRAQEIRYGGAIAVGALAVIAIGGYAVSTDPYRLPGATVTTSTHP